MDFQRQYLRFMILCFMYFYVFAYTEHVPTIPDIIRIIIRFLTMLFCLYSIIMHVYL
uniref:Uncharacterized protein n=1 Tax=Anguilla anguilla TaxID=7936 RepID=A0A0E9PIM3_ANGAN